MLHPVGSHSSSVYWRRRLLLLGCLALVVVLIVLTLRAVFGGGDGGGPAAADTPSTSAPATHLNSTSASPSRTRSSASAPPSSTARTTTSSGAASSSPAGRPVTCPAKQLQVAAEVAKDSYSVGDQPVVMLQVTNAGPGPCVQDLADSQVVLEVHNGASRVWGSHDCKIEPGVHDRTLAVDQPVRVSIVWSGLSSQPHCAGTRQRVGAGTYTLYATLSGHRGQAAQFAIS
jgi:hypothetical protein